MSLYSLVATGVSCTVIPWFCIPSLMLFRCHMSALTHLNSSVISILATLCLLYKYTEKYSPVQNYSPLKNILLNRFLFPCILFFTEEYSSLFFIEEYSPLKNILQWRICWPYIILFPIIHSERDRGLPLLSSMIGGDIVCELESHNLQACVAGSL